MNHRRDRLPALLCASVLFVAATAQAQDNPQVGAGVPPRNTNVAASEIVGGVAAEVDTFPLSANVSLSNAFGSGWLSPGYSFVPAYTQTLTPMLSYRLPEVDWLPKMALSTKLDVSIQWISNAQSSVYDRIARLSDLYAGLNFPSLYKEEITGLSFSGGLNARAPLSMNSRRWNVLGSVGLGGSVSWSTEHLGDLLPEWLGDLSVSYAPSASVIGHLYPNASLPCDAAPLDPTLTRYGNAIENLERIPLMIPREGEILPDGTCVVGGRRSIGSFSHAASLGWSLGKHSVNASVGLLYQILAPLRDAPELRSPFATTQGWTELSTGSLIYSYQVPMESFDLPIDTNMRVTAGVSSLQPSYDAGGRTLRFPFWDFATPANNFSAAFVSLDVGI